MSKSAKSVTAVLELDRPALELDRPSSLEDNVSRIITDVVFKGTSRTEMGKYNKIKVYGIEEVTFPIYTNARVIIVRFHGTIGVFTDSIDIASRYVELIKLYKIHFSMYKNVVSNCGNHIFGASIFDNPFDKYIMTHAFSINILHGIYAVYLTAEMYCIIDNSHYTIPIVFVEKIEDIPDDLIHGLLEHNAVIKTQIPMNDEIMAKYKFAVISGKKAFTKHPVFVNNLVYHTTYVTPSTPKLQVKSTNKSEKRKVEDE